MTIKVNFKPGGSYGQPDLQAQFMSLFSNAVSEGLQVVECSPASLNVNVASGSLMNNGYFFHSEVTVTVPITTNTSGYTRIDTLCADITNENFTVVPGIPSSSPVPPTITDNMLFPLATVTIGNNVSVLNNPSIQTIAPPTSFRIGGLTVKLGSGTANGIVSNGKIHGNINFDTPFTNKCQFVMCTDRGQAAYAFGVDYQTITKTGFTWWASTTDTTTAPAFLAVGY